METSKYLGFIMKSKSHTKNNETSLKILFMDSNYSVRICNEVLPRNRELTVDVVRCLSIEYTTVNIVSIYTTVQLLPSTVQTQGDKYRKSATDCTHQQIRFVRRAGGRARFLQGSNEVKPPTRVEHWYIRMHRRPEWGGKHQGLVENFQGSRHSKATQIQVRF